MLALDGLIVCLLQKEDLGMAFTSHSNAKASGARVQFVASILIMYRFRITALYSGHVTVNMVCADTCLGTSCG